MQPAIPGVRVKPNLLYGHVNLVLITGLVITALSHTQCCYIVTPLCILLLFCRNYFIAVYRHMLITAIQIMLRKSKEIVRRILYAHACSEIRAASGRLRLKCDSTRTETRFLLSTKWTSPFKSAGGVSSVDYWQPSFAHQR